MTHIAYCLFETPLGSCGIAWSQPVSSRTSPAVTLLQLPEATREMTESRIARNAGARKSSAPPPQIAAVIKRVRKHLQGDVQDFFDITLDLDGADPFARLVYQAARQVPTGQTTTYGELAKAVDRPAAARAVGQALARNPIGHHPVPSGPGRRRQTGRVFRSRRTIDQGEYAGHRRCHFRATSDNQIGEAPSACGRTAKSPRSTAGPLHGQADRVQAEIGAFLLCNPV